MADNPPLAEPSDVAAVLGRDLTSEEAIRVVPILLKASELFRDEADQLFTAGDSIVRLKSNGGLILLNQRPITEIRSVVDDHDCPVRYKRRGQWLHTHLRSDRFATVDYSHGDAEIPALVRTTVAEVAMKVLNIPEEAAAGVVQSSETQGPFTESQTYATWAQGGQTMLAPSDVAIARKYKLRAPRILVPRAH